MGLNERLNNTSTLKTIGSMLPIRSHVADNIGAHVEKILVIIVLGFRSQSSEAGEEVHRWGSRGGSLIDLTTEELRDLFKSARLTGHTFVEDEGDGLPLNYPTI
jgi:hypothetical protein